ncbi:MAG: 2-oxoglutarate dehydrogenase complex dihydrolipoyllysine-residue succinyltransferase [Pseudomonadota bacterium]
MSIEIIVPALGESVSEATIAKWHKKPGESVKVDELILELETEKVTLEVCASATGVIESIAKEAGANVAVGEVVGKIKEGGVASAPAASSAEPPKVSENKKPESSPAEMLPPSAARIISENNLDAEKISGSGKDGRITKGDAMEYQKNSSSISAIQSSVQPSTQPPVQSSDKPEERVKMSRLRKTIAQRLKDSQNTAAILTTFNEIDMTNVIALRTKYREEFEKKHGIKLGFMSFFIKATVEALKAIPAVNAELEGDELVYKKYYDIGVAVGTKQGLVVPVLRAADRKSFYEIEADIVDFGKRARDGKLAMSDLMGATFSISNGGVYGSLMSTPIINPPQAGILGIHKTQDRPMAIGGKVEIRQMMYIALSYDHRIVDGQEAVTFLVKIKEAIENPERLLLGL